MANITLQDCIDQVRTRLNIENATHITDEEIAIYLNSSFAELFEFLVEANEMWHVVRLTFDIETGEDGYGLPENFWKPLRIDKQLDSSNDRWYELRRINYKDENVCNNPDYNYVGGYAATPRGYTTEVNNDNQAVLRIFPNNLQAGVYRVLYYPSWTDLDVDGYVKVGPIGQHWDEFAIIDTCIKCLMKDQMDYTGFMNQKAAIIARIRNAAAARDAGSIEPKSFSQEPWYDKVLGGSDW
jgi:hypothetical protein